jgi:hypothetical protein
MIGGKCQCGHHEDIPLTETSTERNHAERNKLIGQAKRASDLDVDQWSAIIEQWNGLNSVQRGTRLRRCQANGHTIRIAPIGERFCLECCQYFRGKE